MIRGLKIYGLLLLHDMQMTFLVHPKNIVWLILGLLFSPVLLPIMMIAEREHQNSAIFHGLDKVKAANPRAAQPPKLWIWLFNMLDEKEQRPFATVVLPPVTIRVLTCGGVCWDCHSKNGCALPSPDEPGLDHGCHFSKCTLEIQPGQILTREQLEKLSKPPENT